MTRLTWDQVRSWRLARQHLDRRVPRNRMLQVISDLCGIHAQVQSSAELQVWARVSGVSTGDVRHALWEQRRLVKTWVMRGTLHLVTAEDLPLFVAALRQHDRWWKGAWLRFIGMTEPELRQTLEAIHDSLGARPATREQLAEKVAARVGPGGGERMLSSWGEMLKPAAFHGYLCSGPPRGQNVTFVRPDRWLKGWKVPDSADAWREILRRYLRTYGPATREDFGRWWGMQPAPAGRVMKEWEDDLAEVEVEEYRGWALASELPAMKQSAAGRPLRLLPGFDVYLTGSRPKESLVESRFANRVFREAGWISPVVLVEGKVAGVWKHERSGRRIEVGVEPFASLSADRRKEIAQEADRLGKFLGFPARVSFSSAA